MIREKLIICFIAGLLTIYGSGCVTRTMSIETSPTNALVYIDDKFIGKSPVSTPFTHYGTRKITIEKRDEDGRLTLERKISFEEIKPPIFQVFPIGFVTEIILPIKFEDKREFKYKLEELNLPSIEERKKQTLINAENLRKKMLDL